ncbi:PEGA domain-containing protein [bacterium]|nr:PEGA domain-containing protein [bacterium]
MTLLFCISIQPIILSVQAKTSENSGSDVRNIRLLKAIDLYYNGSFEETNVILNLLIESGKLSQSDQLEAFKFLGASFVLLNNLDNARNEIINALQLNPQLKLDPAIWNPKFVNFFNLVKSEVLGALIVKSEPDSVQLILNGSPAGLTPLIFKNLVSQKYELIFEMPGYYSRVDTVQLRPNTENLISVTLKPKPKTWIWVSGGLILGTSTLLLLLNTNKSSEAQVLEPLGYPPQPPR